MWNLSRSSEVDRIGFLAATLLPSSTASYTTLSAPALTHTVKQVEPKKGEIGAEYTSGDGGKKGIGRRAEMERD